MLHGTFHFCTHLDDVGIARYRYQNTDGTVAVIEQFIAYRFFVAFLDTGNVPETELVIVMPLDKHIADVLYGLELVAHRHSDAVVTIVVITGIAGLVLSVQGGKHFQGLHTEIGHAVL